MSRQGKLNYITMRKLLECQWIKYLQTCISAPMCFLKQAIELQVQLHSPLVPCIFAENNLADCGLPPPFVTQMCRPPGLILRTFHCSEQGLYTPNHNTPPPNNHP